MTKIETNSLHLLVKKQLKLQGKQLSDLFAHMDISRQGYGKAIKGNIKLKHIETIANFLKIPVPELLLPLYYTEPETRAITGTIDHLRAMHTTTDKTGTI